MTETEQEVQAHQDIGINALRGDWKTYDDQTRQILEQILKCYGEVAACLAAKAIWWESTLRGRAAKQHIEHLQGQLNDTHTVLYLQEQEIVRLKATKGRKRIRELEQRCAELEEALVRKPVEEAAERAELVDYILLSGETIEFQMLFSEDGMLVAPEWDGYCTFCNTASLERLKMAKEAIAMVLRGREGRKRLEALN